MRVRIDRHADAVYFEFSRAVAVRQVPLDDGRVLDYAADGTLVGVEILSPSRGVRLDGLPHAEEIARAARRSGLAIGGETGATPATRPATHG